MDQDWVVAGTALVPSRGKSWALVTERVCLGCVQQVCTESCGWRQCKGQGPKGAFQGRWGKARATGGVSKQTLSSLLSCLKVGSLDSYPVD